MKKSISLAQMFENIKETSEDAKLTVETAEKTIQLIEKLVKTREALGLSQRELAEKCGIKQPAIARIETFKVIPKLNTVIKIAEAIGVKITALNTIESTQIQALFSISSIIVQNMTYGDTYLYNTTGGYQWK